jgi:hypothetical protein
MGQVGLRTTGRLFTPLRIGAYYLTRSLVTAWKRWKDLLVITQGRCYCIVGLGSNPISGIENAADYVKAEHLVPRQAGPPPRQ